MAGQRGAGSPAWPTRATERRIEGLRLIREAHDENARLGTLAGASEKHGYAARPCRGLAT